MSPRHSIDFCPICGGGLCGIRICGVAPRRDPERADDSHSNEPHGLVVCDECEAIWLDPDVTTAHQYPAAEDARCPICKEALWSTSSRWADWDDIKVLGWEFAVNPALDAKTDEGIA